MEQTNQVQGQVAPPPQPVINAGGSGPAGQRTQNKKAPELGPGDVLEAGDSYLVANVLNPELANVAFQKLKKEVKWCTMLHRGGEVPRLVAVEGEVAEDGR